MNDKLLSMLGLCRRAGKLELGYDAVAAAITKNKAKLLLLASDLSEKTGESITYLSGQYGPGPIRLPHTMDQIGRAVGKRAGILAVIDAGFAGSIRKLAAVKDEEECLYDD